MFPAIWLLRSSHVNGYSADQTAGFVGQTSKIICYLALQCQLGALCNSFAYYVSLEKNARNRNLAWVTV